jgi:hypothetical protein
MKRRQRLLYSLLRKLKIGIPEEMAPTDHPAPPPITNVLHRAVLQYYREREDYFQIPHYQKIAELAPESTVAAPVPAPGLAYAVEASFPPQTASKRIL